MPLPDLNADVLAVIVQHAASSAEASGDSPTSRFSLRSATLRRLCLVNSLWRSVAQPELDREVLVTPWMYQAVWIAFKGRDEVRRRMVRRLEGVKKHDEGALDSRTLDPIIQLFDNLQELRCEGWRMSLNSLRRTKDLTSVTLIRPTLYAGALELVLPCRLTHLALSGGRKAQLEAVDFAALARAGANNLVRLELGAFSGSQCPGLSSAIPSWLPTLRYLDLRSYVGLYKTEPDGNQYLELLTHLHLCSDLEVLHLPISQFRYPLPLLSTPPALSSLRTLGLHPTTEVEWDDSVTWDEHLPNLIKVLEAGSLPQLEELHIDQGRDLWSSGVGDFGGDLLLEVQELARAKGVRLHLR
ncbi:hypothetical protein JCM10207_001934 [Rhodosporidiobolus poonsookiae]